MSKRKDSRAAISSVRAAASAPRYEFATQLQKFKRQVGRAQAELGKVIIGQKDVVRQLLAALFCRSHCLLVGVPGLAKTLMVSTLADILAVSFKRIQFTPDLMPSDITGTNVIDVDEETQKRDFKFLAGPIFAHIVLADEINRTPPKTQAALLEAMQERQVSVGNVTYELPLPFFVIATQNPIEQEGTYPLPEAQLDRFMFSLHLDYPTEEEEREIFRCTTSAATPQLQSALSAEDIHEIQEVVDRVVVSDHVIQYVTDLVRATRPKDPKAPGFVREMVDWGAGPRAGQYLIRGAKAIAAMDGRFTVACEDIRDVALPVLRHRIGTNFQAEAADVDSVRIVEMLIDAIAEPPD
jgi:MoxR-like ATPase